MAKILKHFYIEPKQAEYLEKESNRTGKSQAQIVRDLIEEKRIKGLDTSNTAQWINLFNTPKLIEWIKQLDTIKMAKMNHTL